MFKSIKRKLKWARSESLHAFACNYSCGWNEILGDVEVFIMAVDVALDPCPMLSESDWFYILTSNFVKKKITSIFKAYWYKKLSNFMMKKNSKKNLHILEDAASRWYWTSECRTFV